MIRNLMFKEPVASLVKGVAMEILCEVRKLLHGADVAQLRNCLECCVKKGRALRSASDDLKGDQEIVTYAVSRGWEAPEWSLR